MAIHELLQIAEQVRFLPRIAAEECVHARIETAQCAACVDACPRDAWVLDDEQLGFDESACDGCGLCVPACPSHAISNTVSITTVWFRARRVALISCERTGHTGDGVIPCVHAIGLDHLLEVYREGVRAVLYTHADCANCPRNGSGASFSRLLENMHSLLRSRAMATLAVQAYSPAEWLARREVLLSQGIADAGADTTRRSFLRDMAGKAMQQGMRSVKIPFPKMEERRMSIDQWLRSTGKDAIYPAAPVIDWDRCTACGACVKVCPNGALRQLQDPPAFVTKPGYCTACRLCEPVCEQKAVRVEEWVSCRMEVTPLKEHRCRSCGVEFFQIEVQEAGTGDQCPICRRTDWHRNLYQVMEG